jgi:hypothetical protein
VALKDSVKIIIVLKLGPYNDTELLARPVALKNGVKIIIVLKLENINNIIKPSV